MPRTETATFPPESLLAIASALQAITQRLTRTAEAMKEKQVSALEIKNQAGLKAGLCALRSFGMAAEEAFEEWSFDQQVFREPAVTVTPAAKPRADGRKSKKQQEPEAASAD